MPLAPRHQPAIGCRPDPTAASADPRLIRPLSSLLSAGLLSRRAASRPTPNQLLAFLFPHSPFSPLAARSAKPMIPMTRSFRFALLAAVTVICAAAPPARAQFLDSKVVSLDAAKTIAAAAEAEAHKQGWTVAIAVVDLSGGLILFHRLDDVQSGSLDVAIAKARTAARFKRSTRVFFDAVAKGNIGILSLSGAVPVPRRPPDLRWGQGHRRRGRERNELRPGRDDRPSRPRRTSALGLCSTRSVPTLFLRLEIGGFTAAARSAISVAHTRHRACGLLEGRGSHPDRNSPRRGSDRHRRNHRRGLVAAGCGRPGRGRRGSTCAQWFHYLVRDWGACDRSPLHEIASRACPCCYGWRVIGDATWPSPRAWRSVLSNTQLLIARNDIQDSRPKRRRFWSTFSTRYPLPATRCGTEGPASASRKID